MAAAARVTLSDPRPPQSPVTGPIQTSMARWNVDSQAKNRAIGLFVTDDVGTNRWRSVRRWGQLDSCVRVIGTLWLPSTGYRSLALSFGIR